MLLTPEQPYARRHKCNCQKDQHEFDGEKAQTDEGCNKQYYRRFVFVFASVASVSHTSSTAFTAFYSAVGNVLQKTAGVIVLRFCSVCVFSLHCFEVELAVAVVS